MDTDIGARPAESPAASADGRRDRAVGVALMLGSALSNQSGAAIGALAFPVIGPVGVVAIRQWVAGTVLLVVGRPRLRTFTRRQWMPVIGLAAVFAAMNLAVYMAIDRIGLGLAVTLEFLGPLTVALAGALTATPTGVRRRITLGCAILAAVGVLVLTRPQPATDYLGIGLGLFAAGCWASYILLNRTVGQRFTGVEGSAAAGAVSALVYVPIGAVALIAHPPTAAALACGATAGVLASVIPFVADVLALRRVPTHFFGICPPTGHRPRHPSPARRRPPRWPGTACARLPAATRPLRAGPARLDTSRPSPGASRLRSTALRPLSRR